MAWNRVADALPAEFVTVLVYYAGIVEYDIAQRELGHWVSVVSGETIGTSKQFPLTHWKPLDRPREEM